MILIFEWSLIVLGGMKLAWAGEFLGLEIQKWKVICEMSLQWWLDQLISRMFNYGSPLL